MSFEQLLVLALVILVPLLERLLKGARARDRPEDRRPAPPFAEASPSPPAPPRAEPPRHVRPAKPEPPARAPGPPQRRDTPPAIPAAARLRRRALAGQLRKAVVLTAILGPCRALQRGDWWEG